MKPRNISQRNCNFWTAYIEFNLNKGPLDINWYLIFSYPGNLYYG